MSEPEYRDGIAASARVGYGPLSVAGATLGLCVMALATLVPSAGALVGWSLFLAPPLVGMVLVVATAGGPRQLGLGLAASGSALVAALIYSIVAAIAGGVAPS